ncbi:DNA-binding transcriptional regulator of sugar metabolism, DeoR/GlpR family [Evansella caseinilytica]|uniref:DNA-binding transcriptional regulator of sugar metabolism, DeoR/GlpR family n=1 Tax=Evansella caseinilytica TaxID=1503961 RepID=A0A1H3TE73_9BACI|nr:DeoR/GlpR family DNA-binding transcription regulator [Evansella caseinilytica]SDZ48536.1 DNA-binding transcriptional regulator of sugar metabolism, DeoR/GlpR family [Evansella caseinilytica]
MLAEERYKKIISLVNEKGSIRVAELSQMFQVTEETIRRDLGKLEASGKLIRSHGGAVSVDTTQPEIPYAKREITNVEEKQKIAAEVIHRINENDRIFLDASTTAWYAASSLPNVPLTVVTNSIKAAIELSDKDKIEVICIGGKLSQQSLSFIGPLAEQSLEQYYVDKAFISSKGVHMARGLSDANEQQAKLKQKIIDLADHVYLMADYSKFGVQAFTKICSLPSIRGVITDSNTDGSVLRELSDSGIDVIVAK